MMNLNLWMNCSFNLFTLRACEEEAVGGCVWLLELWSEPINVIRKWWKNPWAQWWASNLKWNKLSFKKKNPKDDSREDFEWFVSAHLSHTSQLTIFQIAELCFIVFNVFFLLSMQWLMKIDSRLLCVGLHTCSKSLLIDFHNAHKMSTSRRLPGRKEKSIRKSETLKNAVNN